MRGRRLRAIVVFTCLTLGICSVASLRSSYADVQPRLALTTAQVAATVETDPVPHTGDSADDPAIWIHPSDPALSTIIGTDKNGGLAVYDLAGRQLQYLPDGQINNVDLRYNFPLGGQHVAIVAATNRTNDSIAVYRVNPATRLLENAAARTLSAGALVYGFCMYHSAISGRYYGYATTLTGGVVQWELFDNGSGKVDIRQVRAFAMGLSEGCVADDELGYFYVAEELAGIWRYGAEPDASIPPTLVDTTGAGGHLTADVEGLTIYYASGGAGYLIASSQGSSEFVIYGREGDNAYTKTFKIVAGNGIDNVSSTDGIDVTNFGLGGAFPQGVFVAQDNRNDVGNQSYKLVPWQSIATVDTPVLTTDTAWDPRLVGSGTPQPPPPPPPPPSANLLANPGFELDANGDNRPDSWTNNAKFTRGTPAHSGAVAGRLAASDNSGVTISQTINGLTAGTVYGVACWANIPSTNGDAFSFKPQVRWRNASNSTLRTDTLKTYAGATSGWDEARANLTAPAGTTNAQIRLVASSLNLAIYVDDCVLQTAAVGDATAPSVISRSPAAGAIDVDPATNVMATFDEAVTGVSETTFTLTQRGGGAITAAVVYDPASKTATLDPGASLAADTIYDVALTGGIADLAHNALAPIGWSFTTASGADTTPPTVTGASPANGTTGVGLEVNVTATFDDQMDSTTINGSSFTLVAGSTAVPATVDYNPATRTATLDPTASLAPNTAYTARLSNAIANLTGLLLTDTSWTFTTGAGSTSGSFTFPPIVDTYVNQASPTTAYGTAGNLVAVGGSNSKQAFLRFEVSGLPSGATISSAKLRLYVVNDSTSGGIFSRMSDTSWAENITWNNRPTIDGQPIVSLGAVPPNSFVEVDLASAIVGNGVYSFAITLPTTNTNNLGYASRDASDASTRPQLTITVRAP